MKLTWKLKFDFGSANHWFGAIGSNVRKRANQMDQFRTSPEQSYHSHGWINPLGGHMTPIAVNQ